MTQSLDEAAVRHVAHLARLELTGAEVTRFAEQLSAILEYMAQLNQVDTTDVQPTAHTHPVANVFREDAIRNSWRPTEALHNAPERQDGFFRVPKVLDQEGV